MLAKNCDLFIPPVPAVNATFRGPHRTVVIPFGMGKPEWCGYLTVNKV